MAEQGRRFETDRTRAWRQKILTEADEGTISRVEEFGCEVVSVKATLAGMGWSYTIGLYDTTGHPEIVTVGLGPDVAHCALNEAADLQREGIDLSQGRYRDVIGEVECEFRPVDRAWITQLMDGAVWYYQGEDFPVLQAVYPDLENRFPEEKEFDAAFEQPLMQPDRPRTGVEKDFWRSTDPNDSFFDWKFPDPPHTSAYCSQFIHDKTEPVTYVSHDEDGDWQFHGDSMSGGLKPVLLCLHHPIDDDASIKELADLPRGWWAERAAVGEPWQRFQLEAEESDDETEV